jgi:ATP synthase protein I
MCVTVTTHTQMFGWCSVWLGASLAKNFTSTRFLAVEKRPEVPPSSEAGSHAPLSSGAEFAGVGLQMGATIGLCAWLGHWLDGRTGSTPWLMILFVFLGAGAAFYSIYRKVLGPRR